MLVGWESVLLPVIVKGRCRFSHLQRNSRLRTGIYVGLRYLICEDMRGEEASESDTVFSRVTHLLLDSFLQKLSVFLEWMMEESGTTVIFFSHSLRAPSTAADTNTLSVDALPKDDVLRERIFEASSVSSVGLHVTREISIH